MTEKLTKDERDTVRTTSDVSGPKALRIIDTQDAENERLRTEYTDLVSRYGENTGKMILAEARVRELTESLRLAVQGQDSLLASMSVADTRVRELEAENERLRAVIMIQEGPDGCDRCHTLMDGELAATGDICHDCWKGLESRVEELFAAQQSAEARLAAAVGLLTYVLKVSLGKLPEALRSAIREHLACTQPAAPTRAGTPECTVQVVCAAADRVGQPAAPDYRTVRVSSAGMGTVQRFTYETQPAAPTFACAPGQSGYCDGCPVCQPAGPQCNHTEGENGRGTVCESQRGHTDNCSFEDRPAAPTRAKVPGEFASWDVGDRVQLKGPLVDAYAAERASAAAPPRTETQLLIEADNRQAARVTRTEAEQAVLDAMALVPRVSLENSSESPGPIGGACRAELARRGLK